MPTGLVWHELYMWHEPGNFAGPLRPVGHIQPGQHVEHAETKRRLKNLLDLSGMTEQLTPIKPRAASEDELARFHTREYIHRIKALSAALGGDAGENAWFSQGGYEIAALSAGGVIAAVEAVAKGTVKNAYALVRPPGHHAEPHTGMGFCLFANAGIAGLHARHAHNMERIAFVDWDVHHGNGTEAGFFADPNALAISIHQDGVFPLHSGGIDRQGEGKGLGYNINVPLPPGSGSGAYKAVMERIVLPALADFKPDLIIVPCGFDAGPQDPLGRMSVTPDGFREMTRLIMQAADDLCGGRLVLCHEGGYSAATVPFLGLAVIEQLSGLTSGVVDPLTPRLNQTPGQKLEPHQDAYIERARIAAESHTWRRRRT